MYDSVMSLVRSSSTIWPIVQRSTQVVFIQLLPYPQRSCKVLLWIWKCTQERNQLLDYNCFADSKSRSFLLSDPQGLVLWDREKFSLSSFSTSCIFLNSIFRHNWECTCYQISSSKSSCPHKSWLTIISTTTFFSQQFSMAWYKSQHVKQRRYVSVIL